MNWQYLDQAHYFSPDQLCESAEIFPAPQLRKPVVWESLQELLSTGNRLKDFLSKRVASWHLRAVQLPEIRTREVMTLKPHSSGNACAEALSPEQIEKLTQVLELREAVFVKGLGWELPELRVGANRDHALQCLVDERNVVLLRDSNGEIIGSYSFRTASIESALDNFDGSAAKLYGDYLRDQGLLITDVTSDGDLLEIVRGLKRALGVESRQISSEPLLLLNKVRDTVISIKRFAASSHLRIRSRMRRRISRLDSTLLMFVDIAFQCAVLRKRFILMQTHERFFHLLAKIFCEGVHLLAKSTTKKFDGSNDTCFNVLLDLYTVIDYLSNGRPHLYSMFGMRCKPLLLSSLTSEDIP